MPEEKDLGKLQNVVEDRDICIGCGACVAACPYQAFELDSEGKARLIWDKCRDAFDCIPVCPVSCIWKTTEAPEASKKKDKWFRFSQQMTPDEKKRFEDWKTKQSVTGNPA